MNPDDFAARWAADQEHRYQKSLTDNESEEELIYELAEMQEYKMTDDDGNVRFYDPDTGFLHRLSGPAVEWADGSVEYYIEGEKYSKKAFEAFKRFSQGKMTMTDLEKVLAHEVKIIK